MCGRFSLHTPESQIREAFNLEQIETLGLNPRFNIAPSQDIPIVRDTDTGPEITLARWGLVPSWSKEPKSKYLTINARIESVADKPTYRTPFKRRRCLHRLWHWCSLHILSIRAMLTRGLRPLDPRKG